ncbi:MAG: hypothetical protein AB7L41_09860 [Flavobacteriaceae bacterium]
MNKKMILGAAAIAVATLSAPLAANASGFGIGISGPNGSIHISSGHSGHYRPAPNYYLPATIGPRTALWKVQRAGYSRPVIVDQRGSYYTVRAYDRRGHRALLKVSRYNGSVQRLRVASW